MIVGPAKALFMDEISTGLDSSTTYQIVKCLRQSVRVLDSTLIVSLLQPAPETFELFDDLILLSEGQVVYQGPRDLVLDFFHSMGFKCPERKGVADFLQEVGEDQFFVSDIAGSSMTQYRIVMVQYAQQPPSTSIPVFG
jgi:ABC-type multidrug transport system ATPase subunit